MIFVHFFSSILKTHKLWQDNRREKAARQIQAQHGSEAEGGDSPRVFGRFWGDDKPSILTKKSVIGIW